MRIIQLRDKILECLTIYLSIFNAFTFRIHSFLSATSLVSWMSPRMVETSTAEEVELCDVYLKRIEHSGVSVSWNKRVVPLLRTVIKGAIWYVTM